ncbi:hypothetical protein F4824DRAFT_415925 [Ustulina deusta]|nr:hypothetical protein F4824DRAFT_415925 [Ustulina deusta]
MAVLLQHLPNETLILILRFLGAADLQSTLLAQRVSRRFRDVIREAVLRSPSSSSVSFSFSSDVRSDPHHSSSSSSSEVSSRSSSSKAEIAAIIIIITINPLLQGKFAGLFDSASCFTAAERASYWVLTLDGDATLPFRRLPWAAAAASRDVFLRPGASWRGLSPTFGTAPRTRRLDVVKSFESDTASPVAYLQVELPDSGLSMGLLHDVLLCEEALYGSDTGSWRLLVGKSLRSFDVLYRWGCFIIDEPGESQLVSETPDAAILFVRGGEGCSETALGPDEWVPQRLVKSSKPKFLPWQGPLINPEETEWFQ